MNQRIIPILLYRNRGLFKGVQFRRHRFIGDVHNAIRIFSEKEVDELILLDIDASLKHMSPNLALIERIAKECYMPFAVGGGIESIDQIRDVLRAGAEKVVINSAAVKNPDFIKKASEKFGKTSIVTCVDYRRDWLGKNRVYSHAGTKKSAYEVNSFVQLMQHYGAGEIMLQSIDREGCRNGLDLELIRALSSNLTIPLIAAGGVGSCTDIKAGIVQGQASAVGIGSYFVFHGPYQAVLLQYDRKWCES